MIKNNKVLIIFQISKQTDMIASCIEGFTNLFNKISANAQSFPVYKEYLINF